MTSSASTSDPEAPLGISPSELEFWQAKLTELRRGQLETIRSTASKWQASISTLLGVFGAAAYVAGPSTIDKLDTTSAQYAKVGVVTTVVFALVAVLAATYASQGIPVGRSDMDGLKLHNLTIAQTSKAVTGLRISQVTALLAVLVLTVASTLLLLDADAASPSLGQAVLVRSGDEVTCGYVKRLASATVIVDVNGKRLNVESAEIVPVSACPPDGPKS